MQAPTGAGHDWQSPAYARDWVADATARDPERVEQLALLARLIPHAGDALIRVLDIGAGYGVVTEHVLQVFPNARVTLLDFSPAMLEHARERLADRAGQVRWALGDLSRPGWDRELQGPFDAAVSASVLHNLRDGERMRVLYGEIARVLAPGGAFWNLDHVNAGGPRLGERYDAMRPRRGRGTPHTHDTDPAPTLLQTAPAAVGTLREWRFGTDIGSHLQWLREAGFAEVDCVWKSFQRALYGGLMP